MKIIRQKSSTATIAAAVGTLLEYYDASLYSFMAPMLVSIFLPTMDRVSALILTFIMPIMNIFIRPLGALVIGRVGDKYGRKRALVISLSGMTIVTLMIGILPTYNQIGVAAPILFLILRVMQGFFVAGEYNWGAIFMLESISDKYPGLRSGLYCSSVRIGIVIASAIATYVSTLPSSWWRMPYLIGFGLGILGLCFRKYVHESPKFVKSISVESIKVIARKHTLLISTTLVAVYLSATYTMPTVLMNSLLPLATSYSLSQIMAVNTGSTLLAIILLPLFGYLSDKMSYARSMKIAAGLMLVLIYPLVLLIGYDILVLIIFVKICLSILSIWFEAPFHVWIQSQFVVRERYRAIPFTYSVGSQISAAMMPLSLWLWKYTESLMPVCIIIAFWAAVALGVLMVRTNFAYKQAKRL